MNENRPRRRVSRETRHLLTAVLCGVVVLWVLARLRFPDRPPSPNPVAPLISQLAMTPSLDDVAAQISSTQTRLAQSLVVLRPAPIDAFVPPTTAGPPLALRFRPDVAVVLLRPDMQAEWPAETMVIASDRASGLTLVRAAGGGEAPAPWTPRRLQESHYLLATDTLSDRPTLRPVFVGSLEPVVVPEWSREIWRIPARTALEPGEFVFTGTGELVGVAARYDHDTAIVPAANVFELAGRLLETSGTSKPAGEIGLEVQPLTSGLRNATGALNGVVVAWVDPEGPAARQVRVTDVIEAVNGEAMLTPRHWQARMARVVAGERLTIRIRRDGKVIEEEISPAPVVAATQEQPLGLTLRTSPGRGSIVVNVESPSRAEAAGLMPGDLITHIGRTATPTPAQIRAAFMATTEGASIPVAVTRGDSHTVVPLTR